MDSRDQILPLFVMQVLGDVPCMPGLFIAGVFSGALSTVSSGLNSLAAVTQLDLVEGYLDRRMSRKASLWATRAFSVAYGAVCYAFIYLVKYLPGLVEVLVLVGNQFRLGNRTRTLAALPLVVHFLNHES